MRIMNIRKRLAAALCAFAFLLTGCNNTASEIVSEESSQTETTSAVTSEITEAVGGESTPEPMGTPVTLTPFYDAERMELPLSPGTMSKVNNGRLLVLDSTENLKAALVNLNELTYSISDIDTNRTDEDFEYGGYMFMPVFIGGYPAIVDGFTGEIRLMNDELSVIDTFLPDISEVMICDCWDENMVCIRTYGSDEYYLISAENGRLSGEKRRLNSDEEYIQSVVFVSETESIISVYDSERFRTDYYLLNSEKGTKTTLNVSQSEGVSYSNGKIYVYNYIDNEISAYDRAKPYIKSSFSIPREYWMIGSIGKDSMFISTEYSDKLSMSKLLLDTGSVISTLEIPISEQYAGSLWNTVESDGICYIIAFFGGENMLLRWKPAPSVAESGWGALEKPDYSRLSIEIAEEIQSEYGISVVYGNEAVRYFNDYAVVSETDERKIYDALSALKTVFGKFPAGFLRELTGYKSIEVLLTGDILSSGQSRNSITTADAFTTSNDDSEVVVIDVGISLLNETIAHEFMHVIEDIMFYINQNNYDAGYEVFWSWYMLNKPGFEYAYIYTHEDGTTIDDYSPDYGNYYYEGCGVDVNDIYFVDGYSTTFPSEDRARLFQKMLVLADDMPAYFKGENINNKAAYLCLCLRDVFRSLDGCEDIVWERGIRIEHDLDWYRSNYNWADNAAG